MHRRTALRLGVVAATIGSAEAKPFAKPVASLFTPRYRTLLRAVIKRLYPTWSTHTDIVAFIDATLTHPSYDPDIKHFVIQGAQRFDASTQGKFAALSATRQEAAMRAFAHTAYGKAWLRRLLILTTEGLLSDPIYGVNRDERYWRKLHTQGGLPRPKERYVWG